MNHQREENGVRKGQVVGGEDRGTRVGDIVQTLDPRPEQQFQDGTQEDPLHDPIEHARPLTTAGLAVSDRFTAGIKQQPYSSEKCVEQ